MIRELDQLIAWPSQPGKVRVDKGPEFIAETLSKWSEDRKSSIKFIEKGKPQQNGFMERFNRSFREEALDAYQFVRLSKAQVMATAWM